MSNDRGATGDGLKDYVVGGGAGGEVEKEGSLLIGFEEGVVVKAGFKVDVGEAGKAGLLVSGTDDAEGEITAGLKVAGDGVEEGKISTS